jgi:hypothetical protein
MAKISLKSIQNNSINQVKPTTKQKPVKNVEIHASKQSDNVVIKQTKDKPSFNDIMAVIVQLINENYTILIKQLLVDPKR